VPDNFTRSAYALHYYPGVFVIEKRPMQAPAQAERTGERILPYDVGVERYAWLPTPIRRRAQQIKRYVLKKS
jgi:hypothetical protein